ncbi:unnamed protein product [Ectocarpus sp. CCAP 1310/34]|nr:unnamed protein product [Ectocarpus sp. CCAP 1310/34]
MPALDVCRLSRRCGQQVVAAAATAVRRVHSSGGYRFRLEVGSHGRGWGGRGGTSVASFSAAGLRRSGSGRCGGGRGGGVDAAGFLGDGRLGAHPLAGRRVPVVGVRRAQDQLR